MISRSVGLNHWIYGVLFMGMGKTGDGEGIHCVEVG